MGNYEVSALTYDYDIFNSIISIKWTAKLQFMVRDSGTPGLRDSRTPRLLRLPHSQTERYCILGAAHIFSDELFCNMSGKI